MLARFAPLGFILLSFLSCSVPSRLHPWVSLAICLSVMFSQRPQKIEQDKREVGYGQSHSLAAVLTVAAFLYTTMSICLPQPLLEPILPTKPCRISFLDVQSVPTCEGICCPRIPAGRPLTRAGRGVWALEIPTIGKMWTVASLSSLNPPPLSNYSYQQRQEQNLGL